MDQPDSKQNPPWQIDEMKQVGTDYEDEKQVMAYDARMSKFRNIKSEIDDIIKSTGIGKDHTVLEFGCGTGELSIEVSDFCKRVIAVDISGPMLKYAEKKALSRGRDNISFINSGFLNYEHGEGPVDVVISQLALHHLPDFWKMIALKKIFNLLKKGGRFYLRDVVFSVDLKDYSGKIRAALDSFRELAGEEMERNFSNHIKNEYSTFDWIMEEMLYRAGFYIERADYNEHFIAVYTCTKPAKKL